MRTLFFVLFMLFGGYVIAQNQNKIDSLVTQLCKDLDSYKVEGKALNLATFFRTGTVDYLSGIDESLRDSVGYLIHMRLQDKCKDYGELVFRSTENTSDWKLLKERPISSISRKDCKKFFKIGKFWYKTTSGEVVNVEISKRYWQDFYKNGTTSKLKMVERMPCEFKIEFLGSDNPANISTVKGDLYHYELLEKNEDWFLVLYIGPEGNSFYTFKMYF